MTFTEQMQKFIRKAQSRERTVYQRSVEHAFRSVRYGSAVTGAPGQPVDTGELLASWELRSKGRREAIMVSDLPYADIIEENRRGATLRSKVGGFHSVRLTRLAWRRIVRYELSRMGTGPGTGTGVPTAKTSVVRNQQPRDRRGRFGRGRKARIHVRG